MLEEVGKIAGVFSMKKPFDNERDYNIWTKNDGRTGTTDGGSRDIPFSKPAKNSLAARGRSKVVGK